MASEEAAAAKMVGDKYRSFLYDEAEKSTEWRHGGPPSYDDVNKLFEEGRTKVDDGLQSSFSFFSLDPLINSLYLLVACSAGMAKRVTGRNSSECCQVMGDGALTQDSLEGLQDHKP